MPADTLLPGLCSLTLRRLTPDQILRFLAETGLSAVEWWGGEHVPPGDTKTAAALATRCHDQGVRISSYGSYYRCGVSEGAGLPFARVLDTAEALRAPTIRVWAGDTDRADTSAPKLRAVLEDALRVADLARRRGCGITFEFHGGTLTDTPAHAALLAAELDHPAIAFSWQPPHGLDHPESLASLQALLPRLSTLHVYHWTVAPRRPLRWPDDYHRHPLQEGEARWPDYLRLAATTGRTHAALLEFVRDDDPAQARADAATLLRWTRSLPSPRPGTA